MVFVKVRETYDLHTIRNKLTAIAIHTPKSDIIKANYPGLLMQCKAYRPVSCDVKIACASMQPLDPLGVGTEGDVVAPEDMFNPILYKATSNVGMSQIEARMTVLGLSTTGDEGDVIGQGANVDVGTLTGADDFAVYYGLLSDTHSWRHANPTSGLAMTNIRPMCHEVLANFGDSNGGNGNLEAPGGADVSANASIAYQTFRGNPKPLPWINCTSYSSGAGFNPFHNASSASPSTLPAIKEIDVPIINVVCACIIVPPSRLHELFYRMVVEWTLEFSSIRSVNEITNWTGLERIAALSHYQNYSYSSQKALVTGSDSTILEKDACMVSANVDINKVM